MKLMMWLPLLIVGAAFCVQHTNAVPYNLGVLFTGRIARQAGTRYGTAGAYRPNLGYHGVNGGNQRSPPAAQHLSVVKNAVGPPVGAGGAAWPTFGAARPHSGVGGYKFGGMASGRPAHGNDFVVVNAIAGGAALNRAPAGFANQNAVRQSANAVYLPAGANSGVGGRAPLGVYQSG